MTKLYDRYAYRVIWSEENQEHVGLCTELPSLSWLEASAEEAFTGIRNLVKEAIADMEANGEDTPEPLACKKFSGKFQVRITPENHRMLAMQAAENGVSLNRYVSSKLAV